MKRKNKRLILLVAIVATLAFALAACQTQPKLPDPFDVEMNSFVSKLFDEEGNPKP